MSDVRQLAVASVLAVLAAGIAGWRASALLWLVPVALALGFVFNLLRILIICVLAPFFPQHYYALHETAGVLMLWSGLGLVGWLAWRPPVNAHAVRTSTANAAS
jgi:exosortase/archaeosortase family protein